MPELPEVETIARGLHESLVDRRIMGADVGEMTRLSDSSNALVPRVMGKRIDRVWRRGKVLLIDVEDITLGVHLKMTGRMVHYGACPRKYQLTKHDRIAFVLDDGSTLVFSDARKFGYIRAFNSAELGEWTFMKKLGPEPLEMERAEFVDRAKGRMTRLKALLLDQSFVAGVGNIYADESLHRSGLSPLRKAGAVSRKRLERLFDELQDVLRQAIRENGSSISDYRDSGGNAGAFQNNFRVYGRGGEPCRQCGQSLSVTKVASRTTTYCCHCQK